MKVRRLPTVLDAEQWQKGSRIPGVIIEWKPWMSYHQTIMIENNPGVFGFIQTLEGTMQVSPGDWVITGVNGEKWPVKPDIFEKTYERVENE